MTVVLVLVGVLLALPAPALATQPEPLTIEADLWLTGPDSAVGTFETSGSFTDSGGASEVFFIADGTIHGVKVLVSTAGTFTIRFQARMMWTGPTTGIAEGRFVIVSGSGAYEKLHGVGDTYTELDLQASSIQARYTGTAHFD
jgi:hypothetical protein